jgi:hypothetical protein
VSKDRAYLVIADWPTDASQDDRAAILMAVASIDAYRARLAARREPPLLACRVPPDQSARVCTDLWNSRAGGLVLTWEQIAANLDPPRLKTLQPAIDAPEPMFLAPAWAGQSLGLRGADIRLLVRGRTQITLVNREPPDRSYAGPTPFGIGLDHRDLGGVLGGGGIGVGVPDETAFPRPERSTTFTELLDVHTADGGHLRCDASRFSFLFLGDRFGHSDTENLDTTTSLLAEGAPLAAIDTNFSSASLMADCLADFASVKSVRGPRGRHSLLAFSVYSVILARLDAWRRSATR